MIKNFKKIGEYLKPNFDPEYVQYIGKSKSKVVPIVYLFVVNKEIKYIGESRRGYSRPLSYNKNKVMNRQREAINKSLKAGNLVEVYALEIPNQKIIVNGMEIDNYLAQDYEKALIEKFRPSWNGRK